MNMRYIVTIIVIFFIVVLGVLIFGRGPKKAPQVPKALADYATTSVEVRLTTSGIINGDDAHREVVITVGRTERVAQVVQGYQGNVIKTQTFENNDTAYAAFLSALDIAGFSKQKPSKFKTEAGQCALGQRYVYEIINNGDDNLRTWSTSCGGSATFAGNPALVRQLFQNQITDYTQFTSGVIL